MGDRDPAVEAAKRAWNGSITGDPYDDMKAAAREALAPIRDLHRPYRTGGVNYCLECNEHCEPVRKAYWPCATARLVYTTDELGGE